MIGPVLRGGVSLAVLAFAFALSVPAQAEKVLRVGVRDMPATKANAYGRNGPPGNFTWATLFETVTDIDGKGNTPNLSLIETQDVMGYGPPVRNFQNVNLKINYADVDLVE